MPQEFLRSLGVANFLLLIGTCLTILLAGLAYWFPRFVAWLLTACLAILVLVTYEITEQADQDFQKTKLIADVDGSLRTPGCPAERPIGLNIRNLGERTVTSMNWRLLVTRKGENRNLADRFNASKPIRRILRPGANIEICVAMPKVNEPLSLAEADFYPKLSAVQLSSAEIIQDASPLEKGFFPDDD